MVDQQALQNLNQQTPIVNPDGTPTQFFMRLLQGKTGAFSSIEEQIEVLQDEKADKIITITGTGALGGGGDLSMNRTITHDNSAVTPGSYTNADITVDEYGHVTAAADGASGGAGFPVEVISGATYNLLAADNAKYLRFENASAKTMTVQTDATEPQAADSIWEIRNASATDLTIVEDTGVVINPPAGGGLLIEPDQNAWLKRVASDVYDLYGWTTVVPPPFWTPLDLGALLYAWYDPDQQSEADNADVPTLTDFSGNGRDFTTANALNRPWMNYAQINGKRVIEWGKDSGGSAKVTYLQRANSFLASVTAAQWFGVWAADADPAGGGYDGGLLGAINNHGGNCHLPYSDGQAYTGFCSTTRYNWNPSSLATPIIWSEHSAAADWAAWINGATTHTSGSNTVNSGTNTRSFGTGTSGAGSPWKGKSGEMIFCDSKLTTTDRQKVEGYLAHKYGLTGSLPGGHPYISSPP